MDEQTAKSVAAQLRKPQGEWAERIAEFMSAGNGLLIQRTLDVVAPADGDSILEIGMGNGAFVKELINKATIKYCGCDYSEDMVALATKNNQDLVDNGKAAFVHADAANIPFADDSFDKIFSINTIYFWDDAPAIIAEIKRVLKNDGKLIIGMRPKGLMENYPMTKYDFALYTADDVDSLLQVNGFKTESITEEDEPEQEVDGELLQLASLIITATKKSGI